MVIEAGNIVPIRGSKFMLLIQLPAPNTGGVWEITSLWRTGSLAGETTYQRHASTQVFFPLDDAGLQVLSEWVTSMMEKKLKEEGNGHQLGQETHAIIPKLRRVVQEYNEMR